MDERDYKAMNRQQPEVPKGFDGSAKQMRMYFVRNCFWHIEQYIEGDGSRSSAEGAVRALRQHIMEHGK